jgi:hypothetical protein
MPGGNHLTPGLARSTTVTLHEILKVSGGALALLMYVPLIVSAVRDKGVGHSFAMWALWAVLDCTVTISLVVQRGNFWLTAGFAAGSVVLALLLLAQGRFAWGRLETAILLLVLVCLGVWKFSGPKLATVATTLAILVAGVPGMVALWRNPQPAIARIWAGFAVANLLGFFGGTDWSVEERFAPGLFALQTLVLVALGCRPVSTASPVAAPGQNP